MSFCDCNQGHWPCLCGKRDNYNDGAVNSDDPRFSDHIEMKRTDEMKLGEQFRKAEPRPRDILEGAQNVGYEYEDLPGIRVNSSDCPRTGVAFIGEISFKDKNFSWDGPELPELEFQPPPPPTTEYPSDRRKDPIERFSVAAQLQLMKALAILGWAAFFLELLRV